MEDGAEVAPDDVIELLLPRSSEAERGAARRVSTCLRLLLDDAGGAAAEVVATEGADALSGARSALEAVTRDELCEALEALLCVAAAALRSPDSLLELPREEVEQDPHWGRILEARGALGRAPASAALRGALPTLPGPGEAPRDTFRRLLGALRALGGDARPWELRARHLERGPAAAAEGWAAYRGELAERLRGEARALALAGEAGALLELGRVAQAEELLLERELALVSRTPRLARLAVWALLAQGRGEEARSLAGGFAERPGSLPGPVAALLERQPEWAGLLRSAQPAERPAFHGVAREPGREPPARRALAATAVLLVGLGPAHAPQLLGSDVAPGLRARLAGWLRARDGAAGRIGTPEQRALSRGEPIAFDRGAEPLELALEPERARSVALVPIHLRGGLRCDLQGQAPDASPASVRSPDQGVFLGWVHVECAHHLLPSPARLLALRPVWQQAFERALRPAPGTQPRVSPASGRVAEEAEEFVAREGEPGAAAVVVEEQPGLRAVDEEARSSAAAVLSEEVRALVAGFDLRLARRGWAWFAAVDAVPRGARGGAQGAGPGGCAVARAGVREVFEDAALSEQAQRAFELGIPVHLPERDAEGSLARSCLALPLEQEGRVTAVFVLASLRRRDITDALAERLRARLREAGPGWAAAGFRAWHRHRFEEDVHLAAEASPWRVWLGETSGAPHPALRSRGPVGVLGPVGAGKRVLARLLAFLRPERLGRWIEATAGWDWRRAGGRLDPGDGLLVVGVDRFDVAEAQRAADAVDRLRSRGVFVVGTSRAAPGEAAPEGPLAERFARLWLRVPALRDRREELTWLADRLLRSTAEDEGLAPARLSEAARASLWRQEFPGNVRELQALLVRLTLAHPGGLIGPDDLHAAARAMGRTLLERLPSRHPRASDVRAALEETACGSGAWNKTRASRYLGWDPETLSRRIQDLRLTPPSPLSEG